MSMLQNPHVSKFSKKRVFTLFNTSIFLLFMSKLFIIFSALHSIYCKHNSIMFCYLCYLHDPSMLARLLQRPQLLAQLAAIQCLFSVHSVCFFFSHFLQERCRSKQAKQDSVYFFIHINMNIFSEIKNKFEKYSLFPRKNPATGIKK